jgi:hypothetical protein
MQVGDFRESNVAHSFTAWRKIKFSVYNTKKLLKESSRLSGFVNFFLYKKMWSLFGEKRFS